MGSVRSNQFKINRKYDLTSSPNRPEKHENQPAAKSDQNIRRHSRKMEGHHGQLEENHIQAKRRYPDPSSHTKHKKALKPQIQNQGAKFQTRKMQGKVQRTKGQKCRIEEVELHPQCRNQAKKLGLQQGP